MDKMYKNLEIEQDGAVATLWLNRPQVRNAMDEFVIIELTKAIEALERDGSVRVIILGGRGPAFCSGGDLNWMKRMAQYSDLRNQEDAMALATMLYTLRRCSKPTIARIHGAAFAGGLGLAAACDVVVAEIDATFCLSEVRIGLVPATIAPYVVQALGVQACKRYMLTAERLSATDAHQLGLVHEVCQRDELDEKVLGLANQLICGGPNALAQSKKLLDLVMNYPLDETLIQKTAHFIADIRASNEGKEGIAAFLDKRMPSWAVLAKSAK